MMYDNVLLYAYIFWNTAVFLIYGADKFKARHKLRRVPEKTLIACAFLMGAAGAGLGMLVFRHKTRKTKFIVLVPAALILNAAAGYFILGNLFAA